MSLHGPHQFAQKSTSTIFSACKGVMGAISVFASKLLYAYY